MSPGSYAYVTFLVVASFALAYAASRLDETDQSFPWNLVTGFFLLAGIFWFIMSVKAVIEDRCLRRKRKAWLAQSLSARLEIVERKEEYNDYIADTEYSLALRLAHLAGAKPDDPPVWLNVSRECYRVCEDQGSVEIHYLPADPMAFFIQGEVY